MAKPESNIKKHAPSRLSSLSVLETRDELEEKLDKCYKCVNNILNGLSEREANDALNAYISKGAGQHEEVQLGLLFSIMVDSKTAVKCYRDMTLTSRDGLNIVLLKTNTIIYEKWLRLADNVRTQILWLIRELIKNNVPGADSVCFILLRQISGGDISTKNVYLCESVVDMFYENKLWLEKQTGLIPSVVYTFLRVMIDHNLPSLSTVRQKETDLCILLLREKFVECMVIGRDLVRLLQNVSRIPEFEKLWFDLMKNPTEISPQFTGLLQLFQIRTSRKYLVSRLTPDMENKLVFLITKVKFGQQKRYQDWFQRQYLSTPESQTLRCDLIRYICAVFHPSNELLCSDIIPRWAVIGWLLTTCTSPVALSIAKLALFYDWYFFEPEKDSIMNIEPAILVMYHSMRPHPAITATLLDFIARTFNNFCPMLMNQVKQGIRLSLQTIVNKRVLPSLSPLFDNSKLDKELRQLLQETFPEFCSVEVKDEVNKLEPIDVDNSNGENHLDNNSSEVLDARFSDDEDDIPIGRLDNDIKFQPIRDMPCYQHVDISDNIQQLAGDIKDLTVELQSEADQETQCEVVDRLMQFVIQEEEFDQEMASTLAICLCQILNRQFCKTLLPLDIDDESIEDSIGAPLFVIFRFLSQMSEEDPRRQPLLLLLSEMCSRQPRIGYHLIYFLKVSKSSDDKMDTYKDFCKGQDGKDLTACLLGDLQLCLEDDVRLFTYLIPDIYTFFPGIAVGNATLFHMITSSIDGTQLQDLICQILQGHLVMFKNKETFLSVLNESLEWETIEQYFLWQLISSHNIPVEHILSILPKLDFSTHAEALTSMLVLLKQESPTSDLLRPILCRECKKTDLFTPSILKYWAQEHEDRLAEIIYQQLSKVNNSPKKRQRTGNAAKQKENPNLDQILGHLDHFRQVCRNISFLNHESIQIALQQVQQTAGEVQKTKYSDLLALAEDIEDLKRTRVLRGRKASNVSPKVSRTKKVTQEESESESESTEDEEMKPKAKKRKKAAPAIEDDSD